MSFQKVDSLPDFPKLERKILKWWYSSGIVEKYLKKNTSQPENQPTRPARAGRGSPAEGKTARKLFSFLDGPITANNPMGVHHAWGRTYKDLWQRYKTMRGFAQRYQNGFDCQGLWVEVEVEKELGLKSKKDIENLIPGDKFSSLAKFVNLCKKRVFKYARIQSEQSQRLGYFMDWDPPSFYPRAIRAENLSAKIRGSYYTLSDENNDMIWHFLKKCHEKGWIYRGKDVVPWCLRCGTAISEHEIATEGYKDLTHTSLYLKLPLKDRKDAFFLVWTTTPWTLPANTALAVGEEIPYVKAKKDGQTYILAKEKLSLLGGAEVIEELPGEKLVGLSYVGPFEELSVQKDLDRHVVTAPFVSTEEGTGIVHIAPGSGREDYQLAQEKELPVVESLDEEGNFLEGFGKYTGRNALEVAGEIIKDLEGRGFLFKTEKYTHRYPVCWRCGTELIFRLVEEWYIKMEDLRVPMMEVTKRIRWIPEFGLERELDWLKNMQDWLISKSRFWGLALPIYPCDRCGYLEVIGSREELKEKAVEGWKEFEGHSPHRPWIDQVKIGCPSCKNKVSRIPDVGNPWLDAGIVPFSTYLDPKTKKISYLTDRKYWKKWFPADFITESFPGQFRNWFYSLLAMATVLENRPPFKTVLGHAQVRDEKGREMHKSWGNAIDFDEAADKMGADVMRFMYALQNPSENINFGYGPADILRRRFFLIFWNVYKFFIDNARSEGWKPLKPHSLFPSPYSLLDKWIISRMVTLINLAEESLDNYDVANFARRAEEFVVSDLSQWYVRRSRERLGPHFSSQADKNSCYLTLYYILLTLAKILSPLIPFLAEEMYQNLTQNFYQKGGSVSLEDWPTVNVRWINRSLEEKMDLARQIVEKAHAQRKEKGIRVRQPLKNLKIEGVRVRVEKEIEELIKDEINVKEITWGKKTGDLKVELDTKLTPELLAEGHAREMIREIQDLRKKRGLKLTDKIEVVYPPKAENKLAVAGFSEYIRRKTQAVGLRPGSKYVVTRI